uniref:Uncharacterized protein n=1 Tax=Anguilla anguilla TaxID=7936 RepID=A0A0E9QP89_ANGAN
MCAKLMLGSRVKSSEGGFSGRVSHR